MVLYRPRYSNTREGTVMCKVALDFDGHDIVSGVQITLDVRTGFEGLAKKVYIND